LAMIHSLDFLATGADFCQNGINAYFFTNGHRENDYIFERYEYDYNYDKDKFYK